MLIERVEQQLRIATRIYQFFGYGSTDAIIFDFVTDKESEEYRFMHNYARTVVSITHGLSDSTDTRFVVIRNHVTGVGHLYTSVSDEAWAAFVQELTHGN